MFFVFDKQKIYSYVVAASTVAVLFILSFFFMNTDMQTKETSTNIYNKIEENDISSSNNIINLNK